MLNPFIHHVPKNLLLKVSQSNALEFLRYCNDCYVHALNKSEDNQYTRFEPAREAMHKINIQIIAKEILKHYLTGNAPAREFRIKITHIQRITLSVMFKRLEAPPCLRELEFKIINKLTF